MSRYEVKFLSTYSRSTEIVVRERKTGRVVRSGFSTSSEAQKFADSLS